MQRFTLVIALLLSILVLTAVLASFAQTADGLPAQISCVPGTTVFLQGTGQVGTALLVQFDGIYVGGGSVKPGGIYNIPLAIDLAIRSGEYPVVVEVRGTREIIDQTLCVVPGPGGEFTPTPDPAAVSTDIPTDEADLDAEPTATSAPQPTSTPTPTPDDTDDPGDQSDTTEITIVQSPGRVNRGDTAYLEIRAEPITRCSILVFYPDSPDGQPVVDGLQDQTSDENGDVIWEWLVEDDVDTGTHQITVTCGDQTAETDITVLE